MAAMGNRRLLLVVPAILALTVAGCGGGDSGPSPDPTAAALAAGLASGDLSKVTFVDATSGDVQREYAALVAGLGEVKPQVTVASVTKKGDAAATADLHWTWPVGSGWSYTSQAPMKASGSTWQVDWSNAVVQPDLQTGDTVHSSVIGAKRGDILGPHGVGLVTDRPVVRFGVDRNKVPLPRAADSARRL